MFKLPEYINSCINKFHKQGFQIYVVGGAVRDLILEKNIDNWDLTTDAVPDEILKIYPDGFYNNAFGTVGITLEVEQKKIILEITTFRKESEYTDSRHPQKVEWTKSINEDLARRDFTINSIAYDGKKIIDPFEGQKHLQQKLIVAVGNADKRFTEDALRMMRAIRFASELGFLIETKTRLSIQENSGLIRKISWERIRDELFKIIGSDHPSEGILFLRNTNLLQYILPELDICFTIPQKSPKRHHIYDVGTHLVMSLKNCPSKDVITRLASLLHDVGKAKTFRKNHETGLITFYNHEVVGTKMTSMIADRLKLSNEQKQKLVKLVQYHQFTVSELQTDKAVRRFIREVGKEYLNDMLDLRTADRIGSGATPTSWRLELFKKRMAEVQKQPFSVTDLKIDGNDVMNILDIKPGKQVGEILKNIFDQVVEGKVKNERNTLINEIKTIK
ncbi:MAG: tRNA adenylyl-/cytidylyl-transferase [Candidatus Roizmanbacteria bacterium GW2011_GWA2_36_23]|uniref:tRNA adenylyl-/cytidylyl-transferase n=1 Tax=Candidatus Roizmanbacteria bacterium GW2011_GWA2_36_23 TaxID=1618480 RepID=A0A0G0E5D3_9BACT|nr:MAG: tRNA adenylyl-/cytidylyl-transferase [Candidatus Roizmanbacteria bacterium GW2011_GWA2_36_23]